jgi:SAM-dependent methyltransferase
MIFLDSFACFQILGINRWMPLVVERSGEAPVLEIGCGHGEDTVTLMKAGLNVVAFDISPISVSAAKLRAPRAVIECRDIRDPFPAAATDIGTVVASLSLHYFPWNQTISIIRRIWEGLRPGGIFICRLNSTEDHNFGAGNGTQIEENFYSANGHEKRFFDKTALDRLFAQNWSFLSMEHMTSRKYLKRKALWEVVLEKRG